MGRVFGCRLIVPGVVAEAAAHLVLPPCSDEATPSWPPASPVFFVDVLGVDLDAKGHWNLSDIPLSRFIDILSSLRADFSLIPEKCNEYSISRLLMPGTYSDWRYSA